MILLLITLLYALRRWLLGLLIEGDAPYSLGKGRQRVGQISLNKGNGRARLRIV